MQKLHEENEKLFDRLTGKSGLGSAPQVVTKYSLSLLLCSAFLTSFSITWLFRGTAVLHASVIFVGHLVATFFC
jgi:hypothetical protein